MERTPPPFFRQGPSARARLIFFALMAISLLVVDARFGLLSPLRLGVATVLYPVQRLLLLPRDSLEAASHYFGETKQLVDRIDTLQSLEVANAKVLLSAEQLAAENSELRRLLDLRDRVAVPTVAAQMLYQTRDPFSRRMMIDRGTQQGVRVGQPVIDGKGVMGQVTRAFPLSSEVTLITDRRLSIPLTISRTGQRTIGFGTTDGESIELKFLPATVDIAVGDFITTSGLDGLYPPGLPVGKVSAFERGGANQFARVFAIPEARLSTARHVLVLAVDTELALPTERAPSVPTSKATRRTPNQEGVTP